MSPRRTQAEALSRPLTFVYTSVGASEPPRDGQADRQNAPKKACEACRRVKMRCVLETDPPCVRCRRSGHECVVRDGRATRRRRRRTHREDDREPPATSTDAAIQTVYADRAATLESSASYLYNACHGDIAPSDFNAGSREVDSARETPQLPSIYSAVPVGFVKEYASVLSSVSPENRSTTVQTPHPLLGGGSLGLDHGASLGPSRSTKPASNRELRQLITIFTDKMIAFTPAFFPEDFADPAILVDRHPILATCIAYVTARFVPGGCSIRARLISAILELLTSFIHARGTGQEVNLQTLQGLMVLYNYTDIPSPVSKPGANQEGVAGLTFWPLKALTESYAQQLQCHRAYEELQTGDCSLLDTDACRRYACWLWLFNLSHYVSLVSGTPPSIRADAAIRAGPALLRQMHGPPMLMELAAEADICLVWETLRLRGEAIGEWWCRPIIKATYTLESAFDLATSGAFTALEDCERNLDTSLQPDFLRFRAEFFIRFTRFCIHSYNVRSSRGNPMPSTSASGVTAIQKCFHAGNRMVDWMFEMEISDREKIRFASDSSWIMMALCCLFVLQSLGALLELRCDLPEPIETIEKIEDIGQMMIDMSIDSNRGPLIYGQQLRTCSAATREKLQQLHPSTPARAMYDGSSTTFTTQPAQASSLEPTGTEGLFDFGFDSLFSLDGLWDVYSDICPLGPS